VKFQNVGIDEKLMLKPRKFEVYEDPRESYYDTFNSLIHYV